MLSVAAAPAHRGSNSHTRPRSSATTPTRWDWDGSGGAPACAIVARRSRTSRFACAARRYRYGGATPDGFDCSGLVFYAHRQFGLAVPRTSRDQAEEAESVKPRKLQRGDLVFFKIGSRKVNHVGIYIGEASVRARARRGQTGDHQFTRRRVLRGSVFFGGALLGPAAAVIAEYTAA